jgi:WD40 repeat protein
VSVSKQHPPRFAVRVADNRWRGRCAFLDDGQILVCSDIQKVPELRDAKTGALRKAFPEVPDKTTVSGFRLSADRKWLAAATGEEFDPTLTGTPRRDTDITVWEVATGKARGTVTASSLLALAPDGRTLAVTVEGKVELWDVVTGKRLKPAPFAFNAIDAAAFSPDGAWLVVSGLNELACWKWQEGDKYERLKVGRERTGVHRRVDLLAVGHQGVPGQWVVVLPARQ